MAVLLFLLPLAFAPSWMDPANGPKWALLSVGVPVLVLLEVLKGAAGRVTPAQLLALSWFLWAGVTLAWVPSSFDGLHAWFKLLLLLSLFWLGSRLTPAQLQRAALAFGAGLAINGGLAAAELLGYRWFPVVTPPAGLFANKNYLAEAGLLSLTLLGAVLLPRIAEFRRWQLLAAGVITTCVILATVLPRSRAVLLALFGLAVYATWRRSRYWACVIFVLAVIAGLWWFSGRTFSDISVEQRLALWHTTLAGLTWPGRGIGSYWSSFPLMAAGIPGGPAALVWTFALGPDHPHNELLALLSDLGLASVLPLLLALTAWRLAGEPLRYPLLAVFLVSVVAFPLANPCTGAVAFLVAGAATGCGAAARAGSALRRGAGAGGDPAGPRPAVGQPVGPGVGGAARGRDLPAAGADPRGQGQPGGRRARHSADAGAGAAQERPGAVAT